MADERPRSKKSSNYHCSKSHSVNSCRLLCSGLFICYFAMVSFWSSSAVLQAAARLESLKQAEAQLILFAQRYGPNKYQIRPFDTTIQRSCIPSLKPSKKEGDELTIHGIHVQEESSSTGTQKSQYPLVALHGYYNGAAYYYRNLVGLASYYDSVYSLDWLGWGLSSRPNFSNLRSKNSVESAEEWFVESLEAWRQKNGIDKMILLGHSMGGYMSVAYCERYPQHVEKLLLLSPVGVPDENDPSFQERKERFTSSIRSRMFLGVFQTLFDWTTVGSFLRTMVSDERAYGMVSNYVEGRLPQIDASDEQEAVTKYLFNNAVSPGSGEYAIHSILNNNILAKKPLQDRIPKLQIKEVAFLYGQNDWMDMSGALTTQRKCENESGAPKIEVFMVPKAGHLLMLENWKGTNAGLIQAGGGGSTLDSENRPVLLLPGDEPIPDSQVRHAAMQMHYQDKVRRQVYNAAPSRDYPPPQVIVD